MPTRAPRSDGLCDVRMVFGNATSYVEKIKRRGYRREAGHGFRIHSVFIDDGATGSAGQLP